jgi:hypothetical protein
MEPEGANRTGESSSIKFSLLRHRNKLSQVAILSDNLLISRYIP